MVPKVTPRSRWERNFTHSKNSPRSVARSFCGVMSRISSQVALVVSHISAVSVPRTACAFSRTARRQFHTLEGLSRSRATNSITSRAVSGRPVRAKAFDSSLMARMADQPSVSPPLVPGSSDMR